MIGAHRIPRGVLRVVPDLVLAVVLGLLVLAVHDLHYVLTAPYWGDESWVVVATKLPLGDLRQVTASSPIGWAFLLRLVPGGGQRQRLVPLAFAGATVVAAYFVAARLPWAGRVVPRIAAVLAAAGTLLMPSALIRNDLKQYTADGLVAVVLLGLTAALDRRWTRRRVVALAAVTVAAFLFSTADAILAPAAFAAVILSAVLRRSWRPAVETAVAGVGAGVLLGAVFAAFYAHGNTPGLTRYWQDYYLPTHRGPGGALRWLHARAHTWSHELGLGPLSLAVLLVLAGIVVLVLQRQYAAAVFTPAALLLLAALSADQKYPLFDIRTSHFIAVLCVVLAAVGVTGLCAAVARLNRSVALAPAVVALALFGYSVHGDLRGHTIPAENIRTASHYIGSFRQPGDAVVVSMIGSWGYGYYADTGPLTVIHDEANLQQFVAAPRDDPRFVVARQRTAASVQQSLGRARTLAGPEHRIFFAFLHPLIDEVRGAERWGAAHDYHLVAPRRGLLVLIPRR